MRVVLLGVVGVVAVTGVGASATTTSATTPASAVVAGPGIASTAAAAAGAPSGQSDPSAGPPTPCPPGTVWVPPTGDAGFRMGKGTRGAHSVVITHGFCMDVGEVTVRQYTACVTEGACKEPWKADPYSMYPARLDYPVNLVSWPKAKQYCAWTGERLPTEAEWEWAATGPEQSKYPWGDEPRPLLRLRRLHEARRPEVGRRGGRGLRRRRAFPGRRAPKGRSRVARGCAP